MTERADKKALLKSLIERLHKGESPGEIKEEFKESLKGVSVAEISKIEEELIKEGMPRESVYLMCDAHIEMFKESMEQASVSVPEGHPIHTLMEEHKALLDLAAKLRDVANNLENGEGLESMPLNFKALSHIIEHLKDSEKHYLREENALFPHLEKHGITEPPQVMWMEHDKIRSIKKELFSHIESHGKRGFDEFVDGLRGLAAFLAETLANHFFKENNILFPTALQVIGEDEWKEIESDFREIGYCCFTPKVSGAGERVVQPAESEETDDFSLVEEAGVGGCAAHSETDDPPAKGTGTGRAAVEGDAISFDTGELSASELEAILNSLPVDITFVDKDDKVRYFSQTADRIFVRAKSVIGREVRQCHPQKSLHKVNRILDDFKSGKRDVAEFWIDLNERLIYIRYFPVRDKGGDYLGCLEVTQDITDIKKIEGEKRLLD